MKLIAILTASVLFMFEHPKFLTISLFSPFAGVAQQYMFATNTADTSGGVYETNSPTNIHPNRRYMMLWNKRQMNIRAKRVFLDSVKKENKTIPSTAKFQWVDETTGEQGLSKMDSLEKWIQNNVSMPTSNPTITGVGISVASSSGSYTLTNSSPDQTVRIIPGVGTSTSGAYPNITVTNTAPDQTVVITGANGVVSAGSYPNFTLSASSRTFTTSSRSLSTTGTNNTFVINATKDARVNYTIQFSVNLTLTPPLTSNAVVQLDYSIDNGSTWVPVSDVSQQYGVAVTLQNTTRNNLSGEIPAGARVRIYNSTNSNTTTTIVRQQEVTY